MQSQQSREEEQDDPADDFVMVDRVPKQQLQGLLSRDRRWSCSVPRMRYYSSDPAEGVDIAMGESGLAAEEPITVGEMMQRTVVRVPRHVALRYKAMGSWRDVTYREYYNQCVSAAKAFIKVSCFCGVLIFIEW